MYISGLSKSLSVSPPRSASQGTILTLESFRQYLTSCLTQNTIKRCYFANQFPQQNQIDTTNVIPLLNKRDVTIFQTPTRALNLHYLIYSELIIDHNATTEQ